MFSLLSKFLACVVLLSLIGIYAKKIERNLAYSLVELCKYELGNIDEALQVNKDNLPKKQQGFIKYVVKYFDKINLKDMTMDRWGVRVKYVNLPKVDEYKIISAGPDRTFKTEDDIILYRHGGKADFSISPVHALKEELRVSLLQVGERQEEVEDHLPSIYNNTKQAYELINSEDKILFRELLEELD
jgi:hypothetical protein